MSLADMKPSDVAKLRRAWLSPKYRGSFSSANKFYQMVNTEKDAQELDIRDYPTYEQVVRVLETIPVYQQFVKRKKVREFRHVSYEGHPGGGSFIPGAGICMQVDLAEFPTSPAGMHYLLVMVDMWQMYVYARPLETKSKAEVYKAIKAIKDEEHLDRINTISGDEGTEFTSNIGKLAKLGIRYFVLTNPPKAFLAEERIRVIKYRLHRYLRHALTSDWEKHVGEVNSNKRVFL
jgi:hypothetical protein